MATCQCLEILLVDGLEVGTIEYVADRGLGLH